MTMAGRIWSPIWPGEASSPSSTNSPIWASQPSAVDEPEDRRSVGQPQVAQHEGREVAAMNPLACTLAAAAYARTVRATTPMLNRPEEPGRGPAHELATRPADGSPIAAPTPSSTTALSARVTTTLGARAGWPTGRRGR